MYSVLSHPKQIFMIFNTPFARVYGNEFERVDPVSLCQPDESLTVREILIRSVQGMNLDIVRRDLYYDQPEDFVQYDGDHSTLYGDSYDAPDDFLPPDADIVDIHAMLVEQRESERVRRSESILSERERMRTELLAELEASRERNLETSDIMPQAGE